MAQKILGCPEGFPLWQAGGVTNIKRSKKCNYPAFACSSPRRVAVEKRTQQRSTQPAPPFRRDKRNLFVIRIHPKSALRLNIIIFWQKERKSEEEARKTEEKKRINLTLTNQRIESCSQEIAEKRPRFVLFFPLLKTALMRGFLVQLVRGGREGTTTGIYRGKLGSVFNKAKKGFLLSK
jgi:hypothetical protein